MKTKVGLEREALSKAIDAKEKGIWILKLHKMVILILTVTQENHLDELQNSRESDWESSHD